MCGKLENHVAASVSSYSTVSRTTLFIDHARDSKTTPKYYSHPPSSKKKETESGMRRQVLLAQSLEIDECHTFIDDKEQDEWLETEDLIPRTSSGTSWRRVVGVARPRPCLVGWFVLVLLTLCALSITCAIIQKIRIDRFFEDTRRGDVAAFADADDDDLYKNKTHAKNVPSPVTWEDDKNKTHDDCCPYAKVLYKHKYKFIDYRSCRDNKLAHTRHAVGGATWASQIRGAWNILLQGDSLAEQHFLSLVCRAWQEQQQQEEGLLPKSTITLRRKSLRTLAERIRPHNSPAYMWRAKLGPHTVTLVRTNVPVVVPKVNYNAYDYIFVGGWHHGGINQEILAPHVTNMGNRLVWVEALPSHFPSSTTATPNDQQVCAAVNQPVGTPAVNDKLVVWFPDTPILQAAHLYANQSALHVGHMGHGHGDDCLHWCVPSLDAWARQTLLWLFHH